MRVAQARLITATRRRPRPETATICYRGKREAPEGTQRRSRRRRRRTPRLGGPERLALTPGAATGTYGGHGGFRRGRGRVRPGADLDAADRRAYLAAAAGARRRRRGGRRRLGGLLPQPGRHGRVGGELLAIEALTRCEGEAFEGRPRGGGLLPQPSRNRGLGGRPLLLPLEALAGGQGGAFENGITKYGTSAMEGGGGLAVAHVAQRPVWVTGRRLGFGLPSRWSRVCR